MVAQKGGPAPVVGPRSEGGVRIMLSPFRGFYDAQGEADRLFNEMLGGLSRGRGRQGISSSPSGRRPMDVITKDGDLVIRANYPG